MTNFIDAQPSDGALTNRYIVGPTGEIHLPRDWGIELDALYRHFSYWFFGGTSDFFFSTRATGDNWEFPLLVKKRFTRGRNRPFVEAGVNFDLITSINDRMTSSVSLPPPPTITTTTTSNSAEINNNFTAGFTAGAGIDLHILALHIAPAIRYTRWGTRQFTPERRFISNENQVEFLLGITLRGRLAP